MNLSLDQNHVYCHICKEWKKLSTDTYILSHENQDNFEHDQIRCLKCNEDDDLGALLGYRKDIIWMYHHEPD